MKIQSSNIPVALAVGALMGWMGAAQAQTASPPDLNGRWSAQAGAPGGAAPARPAGGNICVVDCGPRGGGAGGGRAGAPGGAPVAGGAPGAGAPGAGGFPGGGAPVAGAPGAGAPGGAGPAAAGGGRAGGGAAGRPAPNFPKYKPEFQAKVAQLSKDQVKLDMSLRCQMPGVPRIGAPAKIVQNKNEVVFLYDDLNGSFFRIIPTDGRGHRENYSSSFLGDAVGKWEGDTLVVDTVGFNEETWLIDNGAFHTANLRVVERIKKVDDNTIEYVATAYDPAVLEEPWQGRTRTLRRSSESLDETPRCEDRTMDKVVDGTHHDNAR